MIDVIAVAAAAFGAALFKYLTAREVLKRANRKDIPAITRAMYRRSDMNRRPRTDLRSDQDEKTQNHDQLGWAT
jgi:hypothetical protein